MSESLPDDTGLLPTIKAYAPGIAICLLLAAFAMWLAETDLIKSQLHWGALLIVILLGMALRTTIKLPVSLSTGVDFCQKPILRLAVAGLGFKLSLSELTHVGGSALLIVVFCTALALYGTRFLGRRMGIQDKLVDLLAFGGGVCGASAIVAADSVIQSEKSEVAASLGIVTLLGTIGIVTYPLLGHWFGLGDFAYSVWNGASLHEMAQVVAAAQGYSPDAEKWSTIVKLARIALLAPLVFALAIEFRSKLGGEVKANVPLVPWFLVLFVLIVILNSTIAIDPAILKLINGKIVLFLLCLGMAGVGLNSGFQDIRAHGWKPLLLGFFQWLALSGLALGLAMFVL